MMSRPTIPRSFPILVALVAALAAGSPATAGAAPGVLIVDGSTIRTAPAAGADLSDLDAPPSAAPGAVTALAARATAPKKKAKKKPKPTFDLAVIRKAINRAGGSPSRRYEARAALTSVDRVAKASPKVSQARRELEAVLKNTTLMARGNRITADRMLMLTETLARNAQWWKLRRTTGSGQRVQFDGSQMLWQYYPGAGMQLQWLGTFGRGNSLYYSGANSVAALAALSDEAIRLGVPRAGGVAWEYFFPFGGGSPPWVSGMAQATGIQVLSRAGTKLARPDLRTEAQSALGILKTPPPAGVQVVDETGTHFLIYSFSSMKVLNAMNQTVNGLYAYVLASPEDVDARLLLLDGLRWLDTNVDRYDTGKWSLYALGGAKASTHYHTVAKDFLKTLCALLKSDAVTPGGGPTGAYPSARICAAADTFSKYLTAR